MEAPLQPAATLHPEERNQRLLTEALDQLRKKTGFEVTLISQRILVAQNLEADALLRVKVGKMEWPFSLSILQRPDSRQIERLIELEVRKTLGGPLVVVTDRIPPPLAARLRRHEIGFLDRQGNVFLPLAVDLRHFDGERAATKITDLAERPDLADLPTPPPPLKAPPLAPRMSSKILVRFYFAVLQRPGLALLPLHLIAKLANISIGSAHYAMGELRRSGYIGLNPKDGIQIVNREELLKRWEEAYLSRVRPRLVLGKFAFHGQRPAGWWRAQPLTVPTARWSGEVAADLLTQNLKPSRYVIHVKKDRLPELIAKLKLIPSADGELEVLERFWDFDASPIQRQDVAPPLAIFGDLLAAENQRSAIVAKELREKLVLGSER